MNRGCLFPFVPVFSIEEKIALFGLPTNEGFKVSNL